MAVCGQKLFIINYSIYSLHFVCRLYTVALFWRLCTDGAGLVFQLPVYILFWRQEKCYPEGSLAPEGLVCLLPVFCSLQLNSSTRPCLVPAPLITPHLTHTFPLTSLSLAFSLSPALALSFFSHLPLLFLTSACSHIPVGDLLFFFCLFFFSCLLFFFFLQYIQVRHYNGSTGVRGPVPTAVR